MLTIPTDEPWVPLRILGLGLDKSQAVEADVFLLTDDEPKLLAGGRGLRLERSEQRDARRCSPTCAPTRAWSGCRDRCGSRTCSCDAPAGDLDYDLAVSTRPNDRRR